MSDYYQPDSDELPLFSSVNKACVIEHPNLPDASAFSKRCREIVMALKQRDMTCVEVETMWHRGQATIGSLRGMGHIIDTVDGVYHYIGFNKDMVRSKTVQALYYATPHWTAKALERKEFDNFKCVQCHASEDLETHHWRYDLFNERLQDLSTLCATCHRTMHENVKGSSVRFPVLITPEVVERILRNGTDK